MPDVLGVPALQVGHPVSLLVAMKADDMPRDAARCGHTVDAR